MSDPLMATLVLIGMVALAVYGIWAIVTQGDNQRLADFGLGVVSAGLIAGAVWISVHFAVVTR